MSEPLFSPDVDAVVVAYLNAVMSANAATKVPDPRPSEFTLVLLTGGGGRRGMVLEDAQVTIEYWGATYAAARAGISAVNAHMFNARFAGTNILDVTAFSLPAELPATDTSQFRFTATYQVTVRASAQ